MVCHLYETIHPVLSHIPNKAPCNKLTLAKVYSYGWLKPRYSYYCFRVHPNIDKSSSRKISEELCSKVIFLCYKISFKIDVS